MVIVVYLMTSTFASELESIQLPTMIASPDEITGSLLGQISTEGNNIKEKQMRLALQIVQLMYSLMMGKDAFRWSSTQAVPWPAATMRGLRLQN